MTEGDIKLMILNASTFAISFSQIEMALKMTLLLLSIGYTAQRWYIMYKKNSEE